MNPEEVHLLFAAQLGIIDPILGQPTNTDLTQIREELITILFPLTYDVENIIHNLIGFVVDEDNYKVLYCSKFPTITKPVVYDNDIPNNATNVDRAKAEAVHAAKIVDY